MLDVQHLLLTTEASIQKRSSEYDAFKVFLLTR